VFDYVAGKQDWLAFGLPIEGKLAEVQTIGQSADRDVPTCALAELLGEVQQRVREAGADACVVINKERVVLGLIREKLWQSNPELVVEEVMEAGPATFRPHVSSDAAAEYMRKKTAPTILVTTPDGRLIGLLQQPK
jgi:Mg/Co/Ni transporter MgtE